MHIPSSAQSIEQIAPDRLKPWARNARTHSKKQIRQVAESIRTFGFTNPVLIDAANTHPRRPLPGRGREAPRPGDGPLHPHRDHDPGTEAGLRDRRQQARAERRLGRGPAGRGAEGAARRRSRLRHRRHRLLDPGDRRPGRGADAGGARRSRGRLAARGRAGALPAGRCLAARPTPADLRQRARPGRRAAADGRRAGADGLHRPALQREDRRPRRRLGADQAPRVRHGLGRDVGRASSPPSCAPASGTSPTPASTAPSTTSAWTGGTCGRCSMLRTASTPSSRT